MRYDGRRGAKTEITMKTTAATSIASEKQVHGPSRQSIAAGKAKRRNNWSKPWSTKEISILKEEYPQGGTSECAKLLPGRTPRAIQLRAHILSLRSNRPWSDPEIDILLKNYPAGGLNACIQLLPHRSRQTIRQRCYLLGIQRT
jgi:hypothetical protein